MWKTLAIVLGFMAIGFLPLAPSDQIVNCSKPDFRQSHLAMCNQVSVNYGRGGGTGGGLLGGILGGLPGIGGLF